VQFPGYYPQLIALYKHICVPFHTADFSYTFSSLSVPRSSKYPARNITATTVYNGNSGKNGWSMPSALLDNAAKASKSEPTYIRAVIHALTYGIFFLEVFWIISFYLWTQWLSLPIWRDREVPKLSFEAWTKMVEPSNFVAKHLGLDLRWRAYVRDILVPLFSAVCTASEEDVLGHPAEEFLGEFCFEQVQFDRTLNSIFWQIIFG
jgi:microfibrillar-associated protein 1